MNFFRLFFDFFPIEYDSLISKTDFTSLWRGWKIHFLYASEDLFYANFMLPKPSRIYKIHNINFYKREWPPPPPPFYKLYKKTGKMVRGAFPYLEDGEMGRQPCLEKWEWTNFYIYKWIDKYFDNFNQTKLISITYSIILNKLFCGTNFRKLLWHFCM